MKAQRVTTAAIIVIALTLSAAAETQRRSKKQQEPAAPPSAPADKRDRAVAAPGSPFHGRAYWQATAQCGGIYFKLGTLQSDAAIRAKVVKPDPAAYARLTKEADGASKAATAFFEAAERFLIDDRKVARDQAVMTYDAVASANGDRLKTAEAAVQAAKSCPELYAACRDAFPRTCAGTLALSN